MTINLGLEVSLIVINNNRSNYVYNQESNFKRTIES